MTSRMLKCAPDRGERAVIAAARCDPRDPAATPLRPLATRRDTATRAVAATHALRRPFTPPPLTFRCVRARRRRPRPKRARRSRRRPSRSTGCVARSAIAGAPCRLASLPLPASRAQSCAPHTLPTRAAPGAPRGQDDRRPVEGGADPAGAPAGGAAAQARVRLAAGGGEARARGARAA
eukprot:1412977-Prymnesium_polylepis.1